MSGGGDIGELLERSTELAALDEHLATIRADAGGRLVLVGGEAGVGKTALVRAFCEGSEARVLWGGCDALYTPRPLGPFHDVAEQAGGELAALVDEGTTPAALVTALAQDLRRRPGTIVVLEDLHWADEATLDAVRLVGRRIATMPALVAITYRDDELDRTHPVRVARRKIGRPPDAAARAPAYLRRHIDRPGGKASAALRNSATQRVAFARRPAGGRGALQAHGRRADARRHPLDPQLRPRRGRRLGGHRLHLPGDEP